MNDFTITDKLGTSYNVVSVESERQWISDNSNNYMFGIVSLKYNTLIGNCGFKNIDHIRQCAEIGLFIGDTKNQNRGYGTETLNLLLNYGFNFLNLHNIMLEVFDFNTIAIHTYKKVGFKEIGKRREAYYLNGKFCDEIYMDILKEEYNQLYLKS